MGWVQIGQGAMHLCGRPGKKRMISLAAARCTRVVTLLAEKEGAQDVRRMIEEAGMQWTWLPLPNGDLPVGASHERLMAAMPMLSAYLDAGDRIAIHCAAGIHRTGMVGYALLRWRGLSEDAAKEAIGQMRATTLEGMHQRHFDWGNSVVRDLGDLNL